MRNTLFILILFISNFNFGQEKLPIPPPEPRYNKTFKHEALSKDAYQVYKANKFLDYKGKDSLIEIIDDKVFKKMDLKKFSFYNWTEIENETAETYKRVGNEYINTFKNDTLIVNSRLENSGITLEMKATYNAKGFILNFEQKIYNAGQLKEIRMKKYEYDDKNRVLKIIYKSKDFENKKIEEVYIISAAYKNNGIEIKSDNGVMFSQFIVNPR